MFKNHGSELKQKRNRHEPIPKVMTRFYSDETSTSETTEPSFELSSSIKSASVPAIITLPTSFSFLSRNIHKTKISKPNLREYISKHATPY